MVGLFWVMVGGGWRVIFRCGEWWWWVVVVGGGGGWWWWVVVGLFWVVGSVRFILGDGG